MTANLHNAHTVAGYRHIRELYAQADDFDKRDGRKAYLRYHNLLHEIAKAYACPFPETVAAFCALSPNNDYKGNLRSLVTMLDYRRKGLDPNEATISTYHHCRTRAALHLTGVDFLSETKGPKTRAFYQNIMDPCEWEPVTVDGHMAHAWFNTEGTMTEAGKLMKGGAYDVIANGIRNLAHDEKMLPNQMQAILWMTRKRVKGVVYSAQLDLLDAFGEGQKTTYRVEDLWPYPKRVA